MLIISVNDEARGKKSFEGDRETIIKRFPFFASHSSDSISVSCDLFIFELLWEGNVRSISTQHAAIVPALIAGTFLHMDLVDSLIDILVADLALLTQLSRESDLTLLPPPLLLKIASAISLPHLELLSSLPETEGGSRRLSHKLFKMKLEAMLRQTPISCCSVCSQLFRVEDADLLRCSSQKASGHIADSAFSLQKHIIQLRVEQKRPWRDLFWTIWGKVHVLYCHRCHQHYQASHLPSCHSNGDHLTSPPLHSHCNTTPWSLLVETLRDHRPLIVPSLFPEQQSLPRVAAASTSGGGIATFSSGGAWGTDISLKGSHQQPFIVMADRVDDHQEAVEVNEEEEEEEEVEEEEEEVPEAKAPVKINSGLEGYQNVFSLDMRPSLGQRSDQEKSHKPRKLRMELLREDDLYRMDLLVKQLLASRSKRVGQPPDPPPVAPAPPPPMPVNEPAVRQMPRAEKERTHRPVPPPNPPPTSSTAKTKSPYLKSRERLSTKPLRPPPPHLPNRDSASSKIGSAIRRPSSAAAVQRSNLHPSQVSASALRAYAWFD